MNARRFVGILALFVMTLTAADVSAGTPNTHAERSWLRQTAKSESPQAHSVVPSLGKSLALALLVGLGGYAVYKRRNITKSAKIANVSAMRILSVTRLSPKAQVVALEVQGRTLLVGATETQITRLGWLDNTNSDDVDVEDDERDDAPTSVEERSPQLRTNLRHETNGSIKKVVDGNESRAKTKAQVKKTSRFRELLADAIGLVPASSIVKSDLNKAPVDELVHAAEDRYLGNHSQSTQTQRMRRESNQTSALIDIEGQAKGLVARLNRPTT
jgi:flagellar biogenesis protein FliO